MISGHMWKWGFWVRVAGRGVLVTTAPPLFSERAGYEKSFRVMGFKFKWLGKS